jgi:hypothetical protein
MKTIREISKPLIPGVIPALIVLLLASLPSFAVSTPAPPKKQQIMLALLLDTSNSMDGLIDQAKSQLWKIVNELAQAKCGDGAAPDIQIALYEYGNSGLPVTSGYIRQVSPFTTDLDVVSEKLFALRTNGGDEYCGQVIKTSLNELAWSSSSEDLKMIFIAGNEAFNQGHVPFSQACALAKEKGVVVNTIFCGNLNEGIETFWKQGADLTSGNYMSINQDERTVYIATPFDDQIDAMNDKLNATYVYYGKDGESKKQLQSYQDANAESYSKSNKVERAVSKSSHAYKNSTWDLVDAAKEDEKAITQAKEQELPKEMRGMTVEQRKAYIKTKTAERENIQAQIMTLNKQRTEYIAKQAPAKANDKTLDAAMINAVRKQAKVKNLMFDSKQ